MSFYVRVATSVAAVLCLTLGSSQPAFSFRQNTDSCEAVLRPTDERFSSDYRLLQSYMQMNAEKEYDRLESLSSKDRGLDVVYKAFSGQYRESKSKSNFGEKVRERISQEGFEYQSSSATSYSRQGPTSEQVDNWLECIRSQGTGGFIMLSTSRDGEGRAPFPVRVDWRFPQTTSSDRAIVEIKIVGGTINGVNQLRSSEVFGGRKTFIVTPDASSGTITMVSNIPGETGELIVDLRPKQILTPVAIVKECAENEDCDRKKVLACLSSSDKPSEILPGIWMQGPDSPDYEGAERKTYGIDFGTWENTQCGVKGSGWHAGVGTCQTGLGTRWQRCHRVRVLTEEMRPQAPATP